MTAVTQLHVGLERRPVTLHYPGAEGVQFHDVLLVLSNPEGTAVQGVGLQLRVLQGEATLMDGPVDLAALGVATEIPAGGELHLSLFRTLQHHARGFGSKINLFGYKAALNWSFRVEAIPTHRSGEGSAWVVTWHPSADDPALVEVDISPA